MNHSNCIKTLKTFFHIWAFLDLLRNISAKKFSKTKVAKKSVKDFLATEVDQICKKEKKAKKEKQLFQGYFFLTESFRFLQPFTACFAPTGFPFSWLQHHNLKCTFSVTHELWTFLVKKREEEQSPAMGRIRIHDLLITRHMLCHWATSKAVYLALIWFNLCYGK